MKVSERLDRRFLPLSAFWRKCTCAAGFMLVLLTCLAGPGSLAAQDSGNGSIIVYVVDANGEPLQHVFNVMLSRVGFQYKNTFQITDTNGVTQFAQLALSPYRITASAPGYEDGGAELELTEARFIVTVTISVHPHDAAEAIPKGMTLAPSAQKEITAGMTDLKAMHYDGARQHFEAAYKLAPGNPDVNDAMGELYISTKDFAKAQSYLQHAISIEPNNVGALTDMGYLQVQQKNYAGAEISLQRSVALAAQDWYPQWLLSVAYLHLSQPDKARTAALAAIKVSKDPQPDAQLTLSESLAVLGRKDEAVAVLEQLLKDSPASPEAATAKSLMERLKPNDSALEAVPGSIAAGAALPTPPDAQRNNFE
jgi:Flp pilus assembly protein TadD